MDEKQAPLLRAVELTRHYRRRTPRGTVRTTALDGVSLEIPAAATVALIGESGSGKSTLARCLALLERPSSGEIYVEGQPTAELSRRELRRLRPFVQLVFQDPASALDARLSALETVEEPLLIARRHAAAERRRRALALMKEVGLPAGVAGRSCAELSGGQKRRLILSRAMAAEPRLLILDESFSGLDLTLQAQVVGLLRELQERRRWAHLLISHDLRLIAGLAESVLVLDGGRLVERGRPEELLIRPRHPATRALVEACAK